MSLLEYDTTRLNTLFAAEQACMVLHAVTCHHATAVQMRASMGTPVRVCSSPLGIWGWCQGCWPALCCSIMLCSPFGTLGGSLNLLQLSFCGSCFSSCCCTSLLQASLQSALQEYHAHVKDDDSQNFRNINTCAHARRCVWR